MNLAEAFIQHIELSALLKYFTFHAVQPGSHYLHVATDHLICGYCDWGTEFLILSILVHLNLETWLSY